VVVGVSDDGVSLPVVHQSEHKVAEWFGEVDRFGAEFDVHAVAVVSDLVDGEQRDSRDRLGVEQHEQPDDAVDVVDAVVVQELSRE